MNNSESLTIALVGPLPPPEGGMANQAKLLSALLRDSGVTVFFVRTNDNYHPHWIKNIKVIRALFRLFFYIRDVWKTAAKVQLFHVLSNSGWSWYLYSAPVIAIGRFRKVPVMINYRGGEADDFFKRAWRWVKPSMERASVITVPTTFLQEVFKKWGIRAEIVPNIIDLEQFYPGSENKSEKKKSAATPLHIIVTRNLEKIYGNDIAIKAFHLILKEFPDARLTIAGSGEEKKSLMALVQQLSLDNPSLKKQVTFVGKLERQEIASLYRDADIMLNASTVDNTPNSIIEALASGVIVVSSRVGGIPFLVEHNKQAVLVDTNTPESLANAVITITADKQLKNTLIQNGLKLVNQFAWNNVQKKLFHNYEMVLKDKSKGEML